MPIFRSGKALSEQRKRIRSKKHELFRIRKEIDAAQGRAEMAEHKKRKQRAQQQLFQLQRELQAAKDDAPGATVMGALPDFLIIGTMKGGTTFLYNLLTQHPHVEPAAFKELQYFTRLFEEEDVEWYRRCFPEPSWKDGQRTITGEASPSYLSHPLVPKRVAQVVPEARLIALLRNPVDRAYSHYQQVVRKGREHLTFEEAIAGKKWRSSGEETRSVKGELLDGLDDDCEYLSRGIYVDQLLRWSSFFPEEQLLVIKSEDLYQRGPDTLRLVLRFLGLPYWEPRSWWMVPKKRNKGKSYERAMEPDTRRRLETFFEPHNRRLYKHLGVDFGW